jgi:hypothetical protein
MLQSGRLSARADLAAPRIALCTYGAASIGRMAQKHCLLGLGMAREFDLDAAIGHSQSSIARARLFGRGATGANAEPGLHRLFILFGAASLAYGDVLGLGVLFAYRALIRGFRNDNLRRSARPSTRN